MAFTHHILGIKAEVYFLTAAVEVMEDTQFLCGIHFCSFGTQCCKPCCQFGANTGKVGSGIFDILFTYRHGHIFLLNDAIAAGCLAHDDIVVFKPIIVQMIFLHLHQNGICKILAVQVPVIQSDFCCGAAIQTIDQSGIIQKHLFLGVLRSNHVIDVRKFEALGIPCADQKDTVVPHFLNGDQILHPFGNTVLFLVFLQHLLNGFHGYFSPPSHVLQWCPSSAHSRGCWV